MYNNEKVNKELKSILSQFKDSYNMACDSSRNAYMKTLSAGAQIPKEGVIYGDEKKKEFDSMCLGYREKTREILNKVIDDIKDRLTEAPSTEAVNSITLLNMRNDVTENEIINLLDKYGDNVQAWSTIKSIANGKGIHSFGDHPDKKLVESVEDLKVSLARTMSSMSATSGHASDGFISMVNYQIDEVFPPEV